MGDAKTKGAATGAGSGALAGASFGPVGAVVGGVAGGALGYFGTPDTPDAPQTPPPDPALVAEYNRQRFAAVTAGVNREDTSLTGRYGALTQGDNAALLARYGANLAMAQAGGVPAGGNPLLARVA